MYRLIIVLFLFFSCNTIQKVITTNAGTSSKPYLFRVKTNNEFCVVNYEIQRSSNKRKWATLTKFLPTNLPDSNIYVYTLPASVYYYYYRVIASMLGGNYYATNPIYTKTK